MRRDCTKKSDKNECLVDREREEEGDKRNYRKTDQRRMLKDILDEENTRKIEKEVKERTE